MKYIYIYIYIYTQHTHTHTHTHTYIYIWTELGKKQRDYALSPNCSLFVFSLSQFISRSTSMYRALLRKKPKHRLRYSRQILSILAFLYSLRSCLLWGLDCESLLILLARCTFVGLSVQVTIYIYIYISIGIKCSMLW